MDQGRPPEPSFEEGGLDEAECGCLGSRRWCAGKENSLCKGPEAEMSKDVKAGMTEAECSILSARKTGATKERIVYPETEDGRVRTGLSKKGLFYLEGGWVCSRGVCVCVRRRPVWRLWGTPSESEQAWPEVAVELERRRLSGGHHRDRPEVDWMSEALGGR